MPTPTSGDDDRKCAGNTKNSVEKLWWSPETKRHLSMVHKSIKGRQETTHHRNSWRKTKWK
jgi:hypothetical protein